MPNQPLWAVVKNCKMNKIIFFISLCIFVSHAGISDQFNFGITYQFYLDSISHGLNNSQHQLGCVTTFYEKNERIYFGLEAGTNTRVIYTRYEDYNNQYYYNLISGWDSLHVTAPIYYKENSNGIYLTPFLMFYYKNIIVTVGGQLDISYRSCSSVDSVYSYYYESDAYYYNNDYLHHEWSNYWHASLGLRYSIGYKLKHFAINVISYDFLQGVGLSLSIFLKPILPKAITERNIF
jgi:hypothetical protein